MNKTLEKTITIRPLNSSDFIDSFNYICSISAEKTFIRVRGENICIQKHNQYVENLLRWMEEGSGLCLVAEFDKKIVSMGEIRALDRTQTHTVRLGISVNKDYRRMGIGSALMKQLIEGAAKLKGIELIALEVFGQNETALRMYEKLGFKVYGKLPNGLKCDDGYDDLIMMYKELKPA